MKYAAETEVSADRSADELQRLIKRAGATRFILDSGERVTRVLFEMNGRYVRIEVKLPTVEECTVNSGGKRMAPKQAQQAAEKEGRRRWRVLVLSIKAKLTAIAEGVTTFEREFLADTVLPGGATVAEEFLPRLAESYRTGKPMDMPKLLGSGAP